MNDKLLIHPVTKTALNAHLQQPPHALLLIGPDGIGKYTLAHTWASRITDQHAVQVVNPDEKGSISIETIRGLYRSARSKQTAHQVIIIDHAERMSLEAENAFLKLLEEPRSGLTFILTAPHSNALLPTITSRVQCVQVQPVSKDELLTEAKKYQLSPTDTTQLLFIARGRPGVAMTLLTKPESLQQERLIMQQAKELLSAPPYQRLLAVGKLASDRSSCIAIVEAMQYMAALQLKRATNTQQSAHWAQLCNALEATLKRLAQNGSVKAQLLALFTKY